jgi:hypothetical protein
MAELSPLLSVARDILRAAKKPLHVDEIAAEAVRTNRNLQLSEDDFSAKVAAALSANLRTKSPSFGKVKNKTGGFKRGVYRVRQGRNTPEPPPQEPPPIVSSNFIGKAGEHAVMAELLYRGFNSSLMAVDEGVDIVASKNNQYFHIQVKTSALGANGKYVFFIKNSSFEANNGGKVFYILVMRNPDGATKFAVIPSVQLSIHRGTGVVGGSNGISLFVTPDEKGRTFTMNKGHSIDQFINNFGLIR